MSWLSEAWKRNKSAIGNLAKNVSPLLAFTPLGLPGAALLAAGGEAARGHTDIGSLVKAGASNAAIGAGARGVVGAAKAAFAPSSSAAGSVAGAAPGGEYASAAPGGEYAGAAPGGEYASAAGPYSGGVPYGAQSAAETGIQQGGKSFLSGLAGGAKDVVGGALGAAKANPLVAGQIASGVLGAREAGAANSLQREQFDFQKQQVAAEQKRREQLAALLGPLYQQAMQSRVNVARNPYA